MDTAKWETYLDKGLANASQWKQLGRELAKLDERHRGQRIEAEERIQNTMTDVDLSAEALSALRALRGERAIPLRPVERAVLAAWGILPREVVTEVGDRELSPLSTAERRRLAMLAVLRSADELT